MKFRSILIVALAAVCCGATAKSPKKKFKAKTFTPSVQSVPADSFSYAVGVAQSASLKQYLVQRQGVDTLYLSEVVRGLTAKVTPEEEKRMKAYFSGVEIAKMNREQLVSSLNKEATGKADTTYMNLEEFNRGLSEGLLGRNTLTADNATNLVERQIKFQQEMLKNLNAEYLEKNKQDKAVKVTPSGLQYKVLTEGKGAVAADTSSVEVHYEGKLIDGTVFDSSYKRNQPATFRCNQVIKGWTEALKMMPEGSTWELTIPYNLAYGERGAGANIPPFATLIFKVELLKVKQ